MNEGNFFTVLGSDSGPNELILVVLVHLLPKSLDALGFLSKNNVS